jgi:hypothetical protein
MVTRDMSIETLHFVDEELSCTQIRNTTALEVVALLDSKFKQVWVL